MSAYYKAAALEFAESVAGKLGSVVDDLPGFAKEQLRGPLQSLAPSAQEMQLSSKGHANRRPATVVVQQNTPSPVRNHTGTTCAASGSRARMGCM